MLAIFLSSSTGLLLGGLAGWLVARRRRAPPALSRVGRDRSGAPPDHLPPLPEGAAIWLVPEPGQILGLVEALALSASRERAVLLVPCPQDRGGLAARLPDHPALFWLDEDRPDCDTVLAAAHALPAAARPLILVCGSGALEAPGEDEPADAVVEELLEESSLPTLVVMSERDPLPRSPSLRWSAAAGELCLESGERVPLEPAARRPQ